MLDTILSTLFYTCISRLSHQSPQCHLHYNHLLSTSHVWYLWTWVAKFEGMRRLLLKEILVVDKMKRFLSDVVKAWRQDMKIVGIIWSAEQHLATNDWTHVFRLLHCQGPGDVLSWPQVNTRTTMEHLQASCHQNMQNILKIRWLLLIVNKLQVFGK